MSTEIKEAEIYKQFVQELEHACNLKSLGALRDRWLGRERGILPLEIKKLPELAPEERREQGRRLNLLKAEIERRLEEKLASLKREEARARLAREAVDVTLPGYPYPLGHKHPVRMVQEEIEAIFASMGFTVIETPELEDEFHNFEGLNMPKDHPARESQDTFYIREDLLLRTHCTPMQIHFMTNNRPPLRVVASGKTYRRDNPDATHSPMFFQNDGLVVDEHVTLGDLKGTLETFLKRLFRPDIKVRFRPSYFPFVEPGAEVDISCIFCRGAGCRLCKQSGWIEILGAGMVHPKVFRAVGYDPEKYTGFAWGMGIDRIVLLKYGVDDIRLLYENDLRFLAQFP